MKLTKTLIACSMLTLVFFSCKKEEDLTPVEPVQYPKTRYIDANVDGKDHSLVAGRDNYNSFYSLNTYRSGWESEIYVDNRLAKNNDYIDSTFTAIQLEVSFMDTFNLGPFNYKQYFEKFKIGSKGFGRTIENFGDSVKEGAIIRYFDTDGTEWNNYASSGQQANSTFNITAVDTVWLDKFKYNDPNILITGNFNCTVYSPTGLKKTITSSEFKLEYQTP
jgi:hypothetical protein